MGLAPLTALMFIEGMVGLARALGPLRSAGWFKPGDAFVPGVVTRVVALELALSALGVALVAAAAPWWQPLTGLAPPLWLIALVALRAGGLSIMTALTGLRRPLAGLAGLFDMIFVLPLVALFGGSLETVVILSTAITVLFAALSVRSRPLDLVALQKSETAREAERKKLAREREEAEVADRWLLGSWLNSVVEHARRPLFVALAGLAIVVPVSASMIVSSLLLIPFVVAARLKPSSSRALRWLRGIVLAGGAFLVIYTLGPAIYRALFPATFGDGTWVAILAWSALVMLPLSVRELPTRSGQLRNAASALISGALLVTLGVGWGVHGFVLGVALGCVVSSIVSMSRKPRAEPMLAD